MHERKMLALVVGLSLGCGSSSGTTLNFNGEYTGTSTNGTSTCPGPWTTGQMADGQFVLTQSGSDVQITTQGATSVAFLVTFGNVSFSGRLSGSHLDAVIVGTTMDREGSCTYTWKGTVAADLSGDTLSGTLTATPNTNGDPDCNVQKVTGCSRVTSFTNTRLPR